MRKLFASLILLLTLFSVPTFSASQSESPSFPSDQAVAYAKQNQVVLTCRGVGEDGHFVAGGQGEIYNVDQTGVWIVTARHVSLNSDSCDAMFPDYSFHTAYISKNYQKSDLAILFVPKAYWPTHASIKHLKLYDNLFDFSEVKQKYNSVGDVLIGFIFDFDYTVHTGKSLLYSPPELLNKIGWPVPPGSVVFTNLYSKPGSSGGGIYDKEGNLVGVVSCGSEVDSNMAWIVDIQKAMDDESP